MMETMIMEMDVILYVLWKLGINVLEEVLLDLIHVGQSVKMEKELGMRLVMMGLLEQGMGVELIVWLNRDGFVLEDRILLLMCVRKYVAILTTTEHTFVTTATSSITTAAINSALSKPDGHVAESTQQQPKYV